MVEAKHFNVPFIIGAGSGAGNMVGKINVQGVARVAVNSSWRDLDNLPGDVVKVRAGEGRGSGTEPRQGERDYKNCREDLRRALDKIVEESGLTRDDVDLVPVVITAGFGFGSGSGPHLVEDLKKWFPKSVVLAFVTKPFDFEGEKVYWNSYSCIREVMKRVGTVLIDNEYLARLVGKDKPINTILELGNRYVARCIETFLRTVTEKSYLSRIDTTDLQKYVGRGFVAFYTRSMNDFDEIHKLYDSDSMLFPEFGYDQGGRMKVAVFIQSYRAPPGAVVEDIVRLAREKFSRAQLQEAKAMIAVGGERVRVSVLIGGLAYEYRPPVGRA